MEERYYTYIRSMVHKLRDSISLLTGSTERYVICIYELPDRSIKGGLILASVLLKDKRINGISDFVNNINKYKRGEEIPVFIFASDSVFSVISTV